MSETVRAFIAVQMPEAVCDVIWQVQDRLQQLSPMRDLHWTDPFDSHITLKFLGEVPIPQLPAILDALDRVAERWEPFSVQLGMLGAFPNVQRPAVLWLGIEAGEKPLTHLYNNVEVALKKIGIKPERKPFHPHVTLARVPKAWSPNEQRAVGDLIGTLALPEAPALTVDAVALMRSILAPEGAHYVRLGNTRFGEAPPLQEDDWEDLP